MSKDHLKLAAERISSGKADSVTVDDVVVTKRPEYLGDPSLSLAEIGDKLGETHATAVDVRARLQVLRTETEVNLAKVRKDLNDALEAFNKSMGETIIELNKLIGTE